MTVPDISDRASAEADKALELRTLFGTASDLLVIEQCNEVHAVCPVAVDNRRCSAEQISVQNEKASTKGETYCSTFCPRGCC